MKTNTYEENKVILRELMTQVGIKDSEELSKQAQISGLQIKRLEYGLIHKLTVENLLKLANSLGLRPEELLAKFGSNSDPESSSPTAMPKITQNWQQEYQQLQVKLADQATNLEKQFQQQCIDAIESWLIQWPTAIAAIAKNPDLPAERLIPLVKPVKELIETWGLTPISEVGAELAYDPQQHELMSGDAEAGTMVKVRYVGYQQGDKLLYKAKVSPLNPG